MNSAVAKRWRWLLQPVDNSPLILFRILFGALMCYEFTQFIANGYIYSNFIQPPFTFPYIGFEFLKPLPGNGMYVYTSVMIALSLMVMLGAWYRFAIAGFSLLWTGMFLMQKVHYNNHYYLMLLLCWLMLLMPANRSFSVDAKRKAGLQTNVCSRYCLLLFVVQISLVYFFAAVNKLYPDWLSGKFIALQFEGLRSRAVTGFFYGQKWFQWLICYGGIGFDLLIVPLLLWKKTRNYGFILSCLFHLFNSYTFNIGIFPYLCIALNFFFIDPAFIRQTIFRQLNPLVAEQASISNRNRLRNKMLIYGLTVYLLFQVLLPLRSWLFPGNVFWTEEGYRHSWKMMLRLKTGVVYFKIKDPVSGKEWEENPGDRFTQYEASWIARSPDMIWQYSQRLREEWIVKGYPQVQVYAIGHATLNGSPPMPLVDSTVNLAAEKWHPFQHSEWLTSGPAY